MAAMELKHGLCARHITVDGCNFDPPLRHARIMRDGYASPTPCLCAQASELDGGKYVLLS